MSLLSQAEKLNTANQLKSWFESSKNSMISAKESYESIKAQLESMKTNPEYTQDDISEVEELLNQLNTIASSFIQ